MVAVALVWARVPPNATNCAVISQPIILSSFHHDHIITHHTGLVFSLDPRDNSQGMYRKSGLTLYYRNIWETLRLEFCCLYSLCSLFSYLLKWFSICWKQNWNSFDVLSGRFEDCRQHGGSFLSYFVTWQHNITRQMKRERLMSET